MRAPGLLVTLSVAVLCLPAACETYSAPETRARLFLDQYLVAADQHAALKLATGRAAAEIQKEIDLLASMEDRQQLLIGLKPEARFEKIYEKPRANGDVAFLFRAEIRRKGVTLQPRDVFVLVGDAGGDLKVKSFNFRSPNDSRTSDTP